MRKLCTAMICLLSLTLASQELSVSRIQKEVNDINSDHALALHTFDIKKIYNPVTESGGSFEVWLDKGVIRKITQVIFLSNGQFITTVYLKNEQPILISETEKHFQWKEVSSGFDYDRLKTDYSELIYSYNWEKDPIQVETRGESLKRETICGISDYYGLLETAKKLMQ